jgi:hypothetical protein
VGNKGEVSNAATTSGAVIQAAGDENKVKVEQEKESLLGAGLEEDQGMLQVDHGLITQQ